MSYNFTEEELKEALIRADFYEMNSLPNDEQIQHTFSLKFERKMRKLIRKSKKQLPRKKPLLHLRKKTLVLIAALIAVLSVSVLAVPPVREKIGDFAAQIYEKVTHLFWEEEEATVNQVEYIQEVYPTFIPDGFELVREYKSNVFFLQYKKEEDFIFYQQKRIEDNSIHLNTEGVELEEAEWNGLSAVYISNQNNQLFLWHDDRYTYQIQSTLDKETILKIAEGVLEAQKEKI
ncbi:DUF4367 domain-containing protein [Clostridium minihomine]|uniref:DUF4367 domain-containing protein n=1 Tax=Clostridium minihomine TaxID=2045012 RepID=UPI000C785DC6|nr:DUF4367 domain-containing protein [Clostridium minihomine]